MNMEPLQFEKHWGKSAHIDLVGCDHDRLTSAPLLEEFILEVISKIGMKAHGSCHIERFGSPDQNLEGFSAMQFIETSSITVHLDEIGNRGYIDIFSCKNFAEQDAFDFAKEFFVAKEGTVTVLER